MGIKVIVGDYKTSKVIYMENVTFLKFMSCCLPPCFSICDILFSQIKTFKKPLWTPVHYHNCPIVQQGKSFIDTAINTLSSFT